MEMQVEDLLNGEDEGYRYEWLLVFSLWARGYFANLGSFHQHHRIPDSFEAPRWHLLTFSLASLLHPLTQISQVSGVQDQIPAAL